jgi:hypothetical protein
VDTDGKIHLYRYEASGESYFSALAHEMVHVFRFDQRKQRGQGAAVQYATVDWFFEEGFAEFVALRVDSSLGGFPWYDFSVTIVAGQWIANGEDIPLSDLRAKHQALNQPCRAQSYVLRSAFFDYLGKTYGNDAVLEMAGQEGAGELSHYPRFFKKDFSALEAEWREALMTAYRKTDEVDELARRYRRESPIQYAPTCKKGAQF